MCECFEIKQTVEEFKYGARPFLRCAIEIPLFAEDAGGEKELNLLIGDLAEKCRAGVKNSLLPNLSEMFDALSLYEQKFKFKPYKYSLSFCVLETDEDVLKIEIRANLSQNGRLIMKNSIPLLWHKEFRCLCEKK